MRQWRVTFAVLGLLFILSVSMLLQGCSGGAAKVASITVFPTPASLAYGQVIQLTPATLDNKGNPVLTAITYTSSNSQVIAVSTSGALCGGTWDTNFINCTPPSTPQPTSATITITAESITVTVPVFLHESVASVQITSAPSGCTSAGNSTAIAAFQATASTNDASVCASQVPPQAAPCPVPAGDLVGQPGVGNNQSAIQWTSADPTVATIDSSGTANSGTATAVTPGLTSILATVGTVTSSAKAFTTCPITSVTLNTSVAQPVSASSGGAATLTATLVDQNNTTYSSTTQTACTTQGTPACSFPAVSWLSTNLSSVTTAGQTKNVTTTSTTASGTTTITTSVPLLSAGATSQKPGTATLVASCSPPNCNKNLASVYSNPITQTTTGNSNATVYAASTQSTTMYAFDASSPLTSSEVAIALPATPNSFLFNHQGTKAVLGSNTGVMLLDPASGAVSTVNFKGTVMRISPDGAFAVVAGQVAGQTQNSIGIIDLAHNSLRTSFAINGTAINPNDPAIANGLPPLNLLADFTPDSQYLWVATTNGSGASPNHLYIYQFNGASAGVSSIALTNPSTDLVFLASGPLAYMLGQTDSHSITAFATCQPSPAPIDTLTGTTPTALRALPDGTGIVALDLSGSTLNFDLVQLTAPQTPFNSCPPTVAGAETLSTQALALNALTAAQVNQFFLSPGGNIVPPGSAAILTTNVPVTATASAQTPSVTGNIVIFTVEQVGAAQAGVTFVVPLLNATVAYQGDALADNSAFYVGGNDGTVHKIASTNGTPTTDIAQIPVLLARPDLIAVRNK